MITFATAQGRTYTVKTDDPASSTGPHPDNVLLHLLSHVPATEFISQPHAIQFDPRKDD